MKIKTLFTKRVRRYACAAVATTVTTFVGLQALSTADAQPCSLQDATKWQVAITNSEVELTPHYIRFMTEAFLRSCPDRPEFASASRIAGIAAADTGDADAAIEHFRHAGRLRDAQASFYAVASNLAANQDLSAWRYRDEMIETWRDRLDRHPMVSISSVKNEFGTIYQIHFAELDAETGARAAWVAVPTGPGWPATISFSNDRFQLALQKIRSGEDDPQARYIELNRCYGRRSLGRVDPRLSSVDFDGAAQAGLTAYLAAPDMQVEMSEITISPCFLHHRILPKPAIQ